MAPLLAWWLFIEVVGWIALPLTLSLFRHLPDRGYPLARLLGILLPGFLAWFVGMWQLATYGRSLLAACLVVVAMLSGVVLWKDRGALQFLRTHWRLVLFHEALFAVALFAGALLRIYGLWSGIAISHTEQPMDFALMNGIIQSRWLPPQDPWLAGHAINYYYLGYFLAASLTLLSGLSASVVFNLNLALLFALTVTCCFSLGYNLSRSIAPTGRGRAIAVGLLAALFTAVVGNQAGGLQVLTGSSSVVALDAGEVWTVLRARLTGQRQAVALTHTVDTGNEFGRFDLFEPTVGWQIHDFDFWWPSRLLWDERPSAQALERLRASGQVWGILLDWRHFVPAEQVQRHYAITEFPFFSFYLGDMHPHVMALPLTLTAMALALNVLLAPERGRPALGPGRWSWLFLILTAIVLGGLYMANSWDFPTYLLLFAAAWTWRWRKEAVGRWSRRDTLAAARDLGLLAVLCVLLYLPFHLTFRSLVGSMPIPPEVLQSPVLGKLVNLPVLSRAFQTVFLVFWDKTSLYTLVAIFGLFLYPAVTWLLAKGIERRTLSRAWIWVPAGLCLPLAVLLRFPLLLIVPLLVLGWTLLGTSRPAEAMVLLMTMLALLLILGCEVVYIRDVFESRMNTVFKFYYQAWVLLAVSGAWTVGEILRSQLRAVHTRVLWAIPLVALLAGALVYPAMALRSAARQERAWTLDGLSHMQRDYPGDYAGVQWILANAEPDTVVLEAVGPDWGYPGRIAMATGRPTLLGWDGHEMQWRGGDPQALAQLGVRRSAVERIYTTTSTAEARELLRQYGVDYVFIGSQEAVYPHEGLAKFAQLGVLAFEAPGVQIYRVTD